MQKRETYRKRILLGKLIFPVCLLLLVNGWVDFSFSSYPTNAVSTSSFHEPFDDYDSFYEWMAETCYDLEDAIPEGDSDEEVPEEKKSFKNQIAHFYFISKLPVTLSIKAVSGINRKASLLLRAIDVPELPPAVVKNVV